MAYTVEQIVREEARLQALIEKELRRFALDGDKAHLNRAEEAADTLLDYEALLRAAAHVRERGAHEG